MILRKPYAILIKNFKLIHAIITICMIYLLYRSYLIFNYVQTYMKADMTTGVDTDITALYFNPWMYILPIVIIIGLSILLVVLIRKKKPFTFYIVNIVIYAVTIVFYSYLRSNFATMEEEALDLQTIRLLFDASILLIGTQFVSMILTFIRAIGFDIKKFDFGKDLMALDVETEDDEEFEVRFNVETNIIKRIINRDFRFGGYIYKENKLLFNTITLVALALILYLIYLAVNIVSPTYEEGAEFQVDNIVLGVTKSYITKKDYRGNVITDDNKSLLVLELYLKGVYKEQKLNTGKSEVKIGDNKYFPTSAEYKDTLFDLGNVYHDDYLDTDFEKVILVYQINDYDLNKEVKFKYINDLEFKNGKINPLYTIVNLHPVDLDEDITTTDIIDGELSIVFPYSFGNTTLEIDKLTLKNYFKNTYKFCVSSSECMNSVEYIRAPLTQNYDQAVIKVKGKLTVDYDGAVDRVSNIANLIDDFGTIVYTIGNKKYTLTNGFNIFYASNYKEDNVCYVAVDEKILNADSANLIIRIRNYNYEFKII